MLIAGDDTVTHRPPAGWHFIVQEPFYVREIDAELWMLERCA